MCPLTTLVDIMFLLIHHTAASIRASLNSERSPFHPLHLHQTKIHPSITNIHARCTNQTKKTVILTLCSNSRNTRPHPSLSLTSAFSECLVSRHRVVPILQSHPLLYPVYALLQSLGVSKSQLFKGSVLSSSIRHPLNMTRSFVNSVI